MTAVLLFVVLAGIGALLRVLVSAALNARWALPMGTLLVNVSGSAALGAAIAADEVVVTVLGVGAVSAYTTFSTFAIEVDALGRRAPAHAVLYAVVTVVACVTAARVGLALVG